MAAVKPLDVFLAENHIPRRTFYDWKDRGYAPRTVKIGRGVFITEQDEREWVEQMRSANAFAEQHIADLTVKLAEAAMELTKAETPEAALKVMWRTSGIAHDLISARSYRAKIIGDADGEAVQTAEREQFIAINDEAVDAAKAALMAGSNSRGAKRARSFVVA